MIALSKTTSYAIRALACLNDPSCQSRQIGEISRCSGVPKPYLAKIFSVLVRNGFLTTKRGYHGGITLARPPAEISLLQIVVAVEGEKWIGDCLLNMQECANQPACPTQKFWQRIRREITDELAHISLADMVAAGKIALQSPRTVKAKTSRCCA